MERAENGSALQLVKLCEFLVGARRAATIGDIQPGQRSDAVDAVGKSLGLVIGGLEITPGLDLFADVVGVLRGVEIVGDDVARGIDDADLAIVKGESVVLLDDAHKQRGKVSEDGDLFAETFHSSLEPFESALGDGERVGK